MLLLNSISKVIQAFSNLLHLDIACFNPNGKLIAATENYIRVKGEKAYAPFFKKLYGNHITFLHQPGKMNMCTGCHYINNCPSKAELIQDMVINGKKYGFISFVSFSDGNERILIENQDYYIKWLSQLKEIIVSILKDSNEFKVEEISSRTAPNYIFGKSSSFLQIQRIIKNMKNSSSSVLITGETGTGKSLLAQYIHSTSVVQNGPFVELNCASIPENLFESELFGYEEGAFTNARKKGKPGYLELADNGTLFLDEIADLPISLQPKLLKVLQDGVIQRVGGTQTRKVNFRIIAATNQSLAKLMNDNLFRSDLFYRLNVIPVTLPSLKERMEDLSIFVSSIIEKLQDRTGKTIYSYTDEYLKSLSSYHWPGNLRELENVIEYSMNMETENILTEHSLPPYIFQNCSTSSIEENEHEPPLAGAERDVIIQKLQYYGNSYNGKQKAAQDLGISVRTLYRKMEKLHILS
ncbi:sigma 54-interacting transcriptional regulator [Bacillus sp. DTU_2020_1000418_1_SI_GHA_SEK_038]|uniref:sigma-54 interaction domain-containing protein n=1 Tax=Bacillus sp. DTU_2020_1000418_1_SI_GHA_SEK_038 TaxID=3077585 RepID=UPI0028E2070C|nr:sigma 54-interacting transcriptional regulator [Bacillus sp. DTU_2020_1000418_1_SI_GHA_SEK_038]WNS76601.1 sigma 54-interacting transcriptional regulator [Bacillus sp. DTU_2020_1000418_1_SI_GHA_SEK_038]